MILQSRIVLLVLALLTGALVAVVGVEHGHRALGKGVTFTVVCDTTAAGVPIQEGTADGSAWTSVYCENNSATSAFWGFGQSNGTAFDTSLAPCISTTAATCLGNSFSVDARRGSLLCKSASSATLKCNAGGP